MISEKLIVVFLNLSVLSIVFSAEKIANSFLSLYVLSANILVNTVLIEFLFSLSKNMLGRVGRVGREGWTTFVLLVG